MVNAAKHIVEGDGLRDFVLLVAVAAAQVAETGGDNLREDGMAGGGEGAGDHGVFAGLALGGDEATAGGRSAGSGH